MKKIIFLMLMCGSILSASAQVTDSTTTTVHKYYYYPSSNVYFDESSGNYWYKDNGSKWTETQTLPTTVTVEKTSPRYSLKYNGTEPWKNNASDIKKYKVKKNGTVKIKTKKDADH